MKFVTTIIIFLSFGVFVGILHGQKPTRIELLRADHMRFERQIAPDARRLLGDVQFRHEDAIMYCDSAYQFIEQNRFNAYGDVFILVNDSVKLYGDKLYYDGDRRIAELHGSVELHDGEMILFTEHLYYYMEENTAMYPDRGRIIDKDNVLTSVWGYYYADDKDLFFKDEVVLINPDYTMHSDTLKYNTVTEKAYFFGPTTIISDDNTIFCMNGWYDTKNDIARFSKDAYFTNDEQFLAGDSLFYDRRKGYGQAKRNVTLKDSVQNTIVTGHFAEHFEREHISEVTQNAMLTVIAGKDSLFMHADTLRSINDSKNDREILFAYHQARFFKSDLQGMSDSIVYNFSDSTIYMFGNPVIWSDVHQLTAERIEVKTDGERAETIHLYDAAFIISEEDSISFNQVKGRTIIGYFQGNQMTKIEVFGNGEALYYVTDERGDLIGINKSLSSDITIYLEDNMVSYIMLYVDSDANLFPPENVPDEERLLRNFEWLENLRPKTKSDIFHWPGLK